MRTSKRGGWAILVAVLFVISCFSAAGQIMVDGKKKWVNQNSKGECLVSAICIEAEDPKYETRWEFYYNDNEQIKQFDFYPGGKDYKCMYRYLISYEGKRAVSMTNKVFWEGKDVTEEWDAKTQYIFGREGRIIEMRCTKTTGQMKEYRKYQFDAKFDKISYRMEGAGQDQFNNTVEQFIVDANSTFLSSEDLISEIALVDRSHMLVQFKSTSKWKEAEEPFQECLVKFNRDIRNRTNIDLFFLLYPVMNTRELCLGLMFPKFRNVPIEIQGKKAKYYIDRYPNTDIIRSITRMNNSGSIGATYKFYYWLNN